MRKQISTILLCLSVTASASLPVLAASEKPAELKEKLNQKIRLQVQNELKNKNIDKKSLVKEIKENVMKTINFKFGRLLNGQVTEVNASSLTVSKDGKTYTVVADANTKIFRHFWGKSLLSEIQVKDKVNVWGKYMDDSKNTIQATMIRDLSIMKRFGTFIGTVGNLSGNTFDLTTQARGLEKVTLNGSVTTKCVSKNEQSINCSDIRNGHRIRVKGMWDKTNANIMDVTHVKDFSLPVRNGSSSSSSSSSSNL